jgi:2,4-dienoyl-CoA reductase-like NADH-dependent reductase (Old Yellow Enzyme family)
MAEMMAPNHDPNERFLKAYSEWADGGWGLIMTGTLNIADIPLIAP